jgi:hypothetical protein
MRKAVVLSGCAIATNDTTQSVGGRQEPELFLCCAITLDSPHRFENLKFAASARTVYGSPPC